MENRVKKADEMTTAVFKQQVERYLTDTQENRWLCERDRDYRDGKQWTDGEIAILRARKQAPVVINRIKPKVEGLLGLYNLRKVDPKAYARTQKHEQASHAITDALRYVADNVDFDMVKMQCAEEFWIEGTCAAMIDVVGAKNGTEIRVRRVPWDRFYYDTNSRELDFSDASWMGMMVWLDHEVAMQMFPDADEEALLTDSTVYTDETFEDRPRWVDRTRKRVRVAYHFYMHKGVWHFCVVSGDNFLIEPQESPFLNDDGDPECPIVAQSANIDRNNNRYGEVRMYISSQDEINHRRSKALHLLSQRQTFGTEGAIGKDIAAIKRELAKPDGHILVRQGEFGKDFGVLPTGDMAQGQFELYSDAKAELDAVGFNAQLAGERQKGDLSGKAIDKLQQAGTVELNRQYSLLSSWEKRIYRCFWARIKQFWDEEKWIRITDDQDNLRWVGLNAQVTLKDMLEEIMEDESRPREMRLGASAQLIMLEQQAPEALQQVMEVRNDVAELDADIILDQSYDVINVQQEQFQLLAQYAQGADIDIIELIELSQLRGKDELIEKIEKRRKEQAEAAGGIQQQQAQELQAKNAEMMTRAALNQTQAEQKQVETQIMLTAPPDASPQIIV